MTCKLFLLLWAAVLGATALAAADATQASLQPIKYREDVAVAASYLDVEVTPEGKLTVAAASLAHELRPEKTAKSQLTPDQIGQLIDAFKNSKDWKEKYSLSPDGPVYTLSYGKKTVHGGLPPAIDHPADLPKAIELLKKLAKETLHASKQNLQ